MPECSFIFPLLNGGRRSGLNNAGIEHYKSNPLGGLARECAQNSLDARCCDTKPAKLVFKFHTLKHDDIPGFSDLRNTFIQCKDFWPEKTKEHFFSQKALTHFDKSEISVLEISDYNTTGLPGGDNEIGSAWYALVMSAGVCNKSVENAGGFGIGKYASFVLSPWRTVFYSSLTTDGEYAFRGVCDNMTHRNSDEKETQNIGYYGRLNGSGSIDSIRNSAEIPVFFRRKEPGTSIYVLAFEIESNSKEKLKEAILENFWPAIFFQKITFEIDGEEINKDNLAEQMVKFDNLKLFIQCLTSKDKIYVKEDLGKLKECELYFILTDEKKREIVCTRSSRMKIQSFDIWKMDDIGFVGLFSCLSKEGNTILKNMEPPEHCKWDYQRTNDDDTSTNENERRNILRRLRDWIRDKIKEQLKANLADETDLNDVSRYFAENPAKDADDSGEHENHDGFSASVKKIKVSKPLTGKVPPRVATPVEAGTEKGDEGLVTPFPLGRHSGGGEGAIRGGEEGGSTGNKQAGNAKKIVFATRCFFDKDEYVIVIYPKNDFAGTLQLMAAGEDDPQKLEIIGARSDTQNLSITRGEIAEITLNAGKQCKIYVKTKEKENFAVEVNGYELH